MMISTTFFTLFSRQAHDSNVRAHCVLQTYDPLSRIITHSYTLLYSRV